MPYELKSFPDLVLFTLSGIVTIDDLLSAAKEMRKIEAEAPVTPHRLSLLHTVEDFDLTYFKMEEFAALRRAAALKNQVRSAFCRALAGAPRICPDVSNAKRQPVDRNPDLFLKSRSPRLAS